MNSIACIKLFKSLPVDIKEKNNFDFSFINEGVLFESSILKEYSKKELTEIVSNIILLNKQLNNTFHKSWNKIATASDVQLKIEQLIHYITTYGFEEAGLYNEDTIYIPSEILEINEENNIPFIVIKSISIIELIEKINELLNSGIALSKEDIEYLAEIIIYYNLQEKADIENCKNKEMRIVLFNLTNTIPKNPEEYLRLTIYKYIGSSLLIKDKKTIIALKAIDYSYNIFDDYVKKYGVSGLASIFLRHKALFLAFKNIKTAKKINQLRRLAKLYHKPMKEDYFNSVTKKLLDDTFDVSVFLKELKDINIFRKVKLYQLLKFYNNENITNILYSIRNGSIYIKDIDNKKLFKIKSCINKYNIVEILLNSICRNIEKNILNKKVYIDTDLSVPTSGKMFCGDIPFGTKFSTKDSFVIGIHWKDITDRTDLDFSMSSLAEKIGWDTFYRNSNALFSGDLTAAPNGASECFFIKKDIEDGIYIFNVNYYNGDSNEDEVPFTLFLAKESEWIHLESKPVNYIVDKSNKLFEATLKIDSIKKKKQVAVLNVKDNIKTFYIMELNVDNTITSKRNNNFIKIINYYSNYLNSYLYFNEVFTKLNIKLVDSAKEADIDLSLNSLTKNSLLNIMK